MHRVLIVGWRGQEEAFLDLVRDHLPKRLERTLVVAADKEEAIQIAGSLQLSRAFPALLASEARGFSSLLQQHQDELAHFLE